SLMGALAGVGVDLLDVEQVVIHNHLTLGVLVATTGSAAAVLDAVDLPMHSRGMSVEIAMDTMNNGRRPSSHAIVILGQPVSAASFQAVASEVAGCGGNIDSIRGIADYPLTGLELMVTVGDDPASDTALRAGLVTVASR